VLTRRTIVAAALALLSAPAKILAQQAVTQWRIGVLMPERPGALEALIEGLSELDYVPGRNITLDVHRTAKTDELPRLAADLVGRDPHVIIAVSGRAVEALKAATKTVPIVMASSGDAVREGLVATLARPGGNVTGLTFISPDIAAKRLQILKEAAPTAIRIGVIGCSSSHPVTTAQWSEVQSAGRRLGIHVAPVKLRSVDDLSRAVEIVRQENVAAILVLDCSWFPVERVTAVVSAFRVPALYPYPRYVRAGGLMSYGPNSEKEYRRAAFFVDKILKGTKPADLPVEQPKHFDLIINLKTAKALGLTIPPPLLLRADQVIE
jgi:putative ABC transport system substrate-binding protein